MPDPYDMEGTDSEEDAAPPQRGMGLRGGAGGSYEEFHDGDESYFTAQPRRAHTLPPAGHDDASTGGSAPEPRLCPGHAPCARAQRPSSAAGEPIAGARTDAGGPRR